MRTLPVLLLTCLSVACGDPGITPPAATADPPAPTPPPDPEPEPGPGVGIFEFPFRAIAISGNWGTNRRVVEAWEDAGSTGPLIPPDYISWLRELHANGILISVALHYEDSMDSTVSWETARDRQIPTWRDD